MFNIFSRNHITSYIALAALCILLNYPYMQVGYSSHMFPQHFTTTLGNWQWAQRFFTNHATTMVLISIFIKFISALMLNSFVNHEKFYAHKNTYTALAFIILSSFYPTFLVMGSATIASLFIIVALRTLYNTHKGLYVRKLIFYIGLYISIASLLYFSSLILLIPICVFLAWVLPFKIKDYVSLFIGFSLPYYFLFLFFLLQKQNPLKHIIIPNIHIKDLQIVSNTFWVLLIYGLVMLLIGLLNKPNSFHFQSIAVKRKWQTIYIAALFMILTVFFTKELPNAGFLIILIPFSIILSKSYSLSNKLMNIFTLLITIVALVFIHWYKLKHII